MMLAMKARLRFALLAPLTLLLGCAVSPANPATPTAPVGPWQNWQIQAGTAITSPPNTYPSFLGAIQIQGTQASGVFTTVNATGSGAPLDYGGAMNSSTQAVTLSTYGYGFGYVSPATPYTLTPVGVIGGCVYPPNYPGAECLAIFSVPSTGVQIADLTGTYAGTLTDGATPSMSGAATLTLTQSATPNSNGAFPVTGTLTFPGGSDLGTVQLGGTVSGEGIALSDPSAAPNSPSIDFIASANPTAAQIAISNLTYNGSGTNATFTGTLTRQ
jgi:hypothetical protein